MEHEREVDWWTGALPFHSAFACSERREVYTMRCSIRHGTYRLLFELTANLTLLSAPQHGTTTTPTTHYSNILLLPTSVSIS